MPEPFGGPLGRMLEELQRRTQPPASVPPPPPPLTHTRQMAEVERQQRLVDELKAAQETRAVAERRTTQLTASKRAEAESEESLRSAARSRLIEELNDPQSLRRAFVLREVL